MESGDADVEFQTVMRAYPLNSKRLTAHSIARIAEALGLPTTASPAELRQLIEGKLIECDREQLNVEVVVATTERGAGIVLQDGEGVIVDIPPGDEEGERSPSASEGEACDGHVDDGGGRPEPPEKR